MADLRQTVTPKSDQLNYDDLIAGPMTIKVTAVKVVSGDQPIHVHYEGDNGKPWKPCKSMRRVLITCWGHEGDDYIGKSITLYGDKTVTWAGKEIGGIRISHMSHIDRIERLMLTTTRGKRAPFVVEPLQIFEGHPVSQEHLDAWRAKFDACMTMAELAEVGAEIKAQQYNATGSELIRGFYQQASDRIRS